MAFEDTADSVCYFVSATRQFPDAAQATCENLGGSLAEPTLTSSQDIQLFLGRLRTIFPAELIAIDAR